MFFSIEDFQKIWESCSKDNTRYIINGVNIRYKQGKEYATFCATDGRKLVQFKVIPKDLEENQFEVDIIIPKETFKLPIMMIDITKENEEIKAKAILKTGGHIDIQLIDGKFPNYEELISKTQPDFVIYLSREFLMDCLKSYLPDKRSNMFGFYFRKDENFVSRKPIEIRKVSDSENNVCILMPMKDKNKDYYEMLKEEQDKLKTEIEKDENKNNDNAE